MKQRKRRRLFSIFLFVQIKWNMFCNPWWWHVFMKAFLVYAFVLVYLWRIYVVVPCVKRWWWRDCWDAALYILSVMSHVVEIKYGRRYMSYLFHVCDGNASGVLCQPWYNVALNYSVLSSLHGLEMQQTPGATHACQLIQWCLMTCCILPTMFLLPRQWEEESKAYPLTSHSRPCLCVYSSVREEKKCEWWWADMEMMTLKSSFQH